MLLIGHYLKDGISTIIGSFAEGERGVVLATGAGVVGMLTQALAGAPLSDQLQIYTNYQDLVDVYRHPLRLALLSDGVRAYTNYQDLVDVYQHPLLLAAPNLRAHPNYQDLVDVYQHPLLSALPDLRTERYSYTDKTGETKWRTNKIPCGNQAQWNLLRAMSRYYKWSIQYVEDLPACREWWELNYG